MRTRSLIVSLLLTVFMAGLALAGDKYNIDVAHSSVGFSVKHLVISNTKGNFKEFTGDLLVDESNITNSSVSITIKVASIDTDDEKRDNHLRSADFFDAAKYPEIKFVSKKISSTDDGYVMTGDLTIRGVTKEVSFPFELNGPVDTPFGRRLGAEASLTINRQDFDVSWNKTLDSGGLVVGNDVKISIELEASKATEGTN